MTKLTYRIATVFAVLALVGSVQAEDKEKSCCSAKVASASSGAAGCDEGKGCSATAAAKCDKACPIALSAKVALASSGAAGCDEGKGCSATAAAECDKGCPIALAMEKLPKMSYAVGDEKTRCPKAAGEIAKKSGAKIQFVVAKKSFAKESDAKLALVEATEEYVSAFAKPKKCSVSGTITVAGQKLSCEIKAGKTAKIVEAAMGKVKFAYLVGDKKCGCPIEAKQVAEKTGEKTLYVVGEEKTACSVTARLNLARAKYQAAVQALVQAEAKAANPENAGA